MHKPLPDMVEMTDNELASAAGIVFRAGLKDGREKSFPRSRDAVMLLIPPYPRRIFHARKLRQIYGAGYDISRRTAEILRESSYAFKRDSL